MKEWIEHIVQLFASHKIIMTGTCKYLYVPLGLVIAVISISAM